MASAQPRRKRATRQTGAGISAGPLPSGRERMQGPGRADPALLRDLDALNTWLGDHVLIAFARCDWENEPVIIWHNARARAFFQEIGAEDGSAFVRLLTPESLLSLRRIGHELSKAPREAGMLRYPVQLHILPASERRALLLEGSIQHAPGKGGAIVLIANPRPESPAETTFRQIADDAVEGIIVHRGDQVLYANHRIAEMLGYDSREELLANLQSISTFLHAEDRQLVLDNINRRLRGEDAPRDYEFRLRRRDGSVIWVNCRAGVIEWEGQPAVVATLFDITERHAATEALLESEAIFHSIFALSPDIITLNEVESTRFVYANQAFLDAFGLSEEEVIGHTSLELNLWRDPSERAALIDELMRRGEIRDLEFTGKSRDGRRFHLSLAAKIIPYRGRPHLLMMGRDITERKRQEAELIRSKEEAELANRAKSEFLANISHELRTPLNAIIGFAEVLEGELFGPLGHARYKEYVGDIREAGSHLLSLINDILDLARMESGHLPIEMADLPLAEVVLPAVRLIAQRAAQRQIAFHYEIPPPDLKLRADRLRLRQVLINILINAIKFTPEGGSVRLWTERLSGPPPEHMAEDWPSGCVLIAIADSGIGMTPAELDKALRPFEQVESVLNRQNEGAGLGLPLSKMLVERQEGVFAIESTRGRGTTVRIYLQPAQGS